MKNILKICTLFFVLLMFACDTNPCDDIVCASGEFCEEGVCIDACQNITCGADSTCVNGNCVANPDPCLNIVCGGDSICVDGNCIPNPDPCLNVDCGTNGTCDEGVCICDIGYELDTMGQCNTMWSTKFVGTYNVTENCSGVSGNNTYNYVASISQIDAQNVTIANFGAFNSSLDVEVTSSLDLTMNNVTDVVNRTFSGTGSMNMNTINITYTVTYSDGTSDTCTATYIRQ